MVDSPWLQCSGTQTMKIKNVLTILRAKLALPTKSLSIGSHYNKKSLRQMDLKIIPSPINLVIFPGTVQRIRQSGPSPYRKYQKHIQVQTGAID